MALTESVDASGSVPAWRVIAGDEAQDVALRSRVVVGALARVGGEHVGAGAAVVAGIGQAFVDLALAVLALVSRQAFARVVGDQIDARGVVQAGRRQALVNVQRAVVGLIASRAGAGVLLRRTRAGSAVLTVLKRETI